MLLTIDHKTHYTYDGPVGYALQQIRLTPKARANQKVLRWNVEVEGGKIEAEYEDQFANKVDLISIEPGATQLTIRSHGEIETTDTAGVVGAHSGFAPLWFYSRPTELTKPGPNIRRIVKTVGGKFQSDIERLHALSATILGEVKYQIGTTGADTPAETAAELGCGVCQDHAHIFIAAARLMDFPARYISGYLKMNDRTEQDATHAWAEAHVAGIGWVGFDVSNQISPDARYVRVATGQDYRDAAPILGMRYGSARTQNMVVSLQVQQ